MDTPLNDEHPRIRASPRFPRERVFTAEVRASVTGCVFAQPPAAVQVLEGERTAGHTFADEDETSDEDVDEQATKHDRDGVDGFNPSVESTPGETSASGTLGGLVRVVLGRVLMGIALGKGNGLHATARDIRMWSPSKTIANPTYSNVSFLLGSSSRVRPTFTSTLTTSITRSSASPSITSRASDQTTPALLALPSSSSTAERRWNKARKVADTTAFEKLVLGMSIEEAEEVVKSSYGHSQLLPTTTTSRQSPVQHIASYTVGMRTKEIAARQFVECVNIGSGAGVEAVLQAGKRIGSRLADLTRMIEKCAGSIGVGITGVSVASGASPGLGMSATAISPSAYLYLYELTDILEESESECSSKAKEDGVTGVGVGREEDMVRDAKPIMMTTMFYRYIITVSANHNYNRTTGTLPAITTARTIPIPAPSSPKPPAAMLLALRRVLGSMAFNFTPDMEDARDRIVDVLADMGRDAGRVGVC
ncbi:hypothetical protein BU17DRAFT_65116 [Hysterangium stoloniferum]|nr:hypothetical protein BU17DRAFT_65116 [Hysterangium stoloniferum]